MPQSAGGIALGQPAGSRRGWRSRLRHRDARQVWFSQAQGPRARDTGGRDRLRPPPASRRDPGRRQKLRGESGRPVWPQRIESASTADTGFRDARMRRHGLRAARGLRSRRARSALAERGDSDGDPLYLLEKVSRVYGDVAPVHALRECDLVIHRGSTSRSPGNRDQGNRRC